MLASHGSKLGAVALVTLLACSNAKPGENSKQSPASESLASAAAAIAFPKPNREQKKELARATELYDKGVDLRSEGDLAGARDELTRALEVQERILGSANDDTLATKRELGMVAYDAEDFETSRDWDDQRLEATATLTGEDRLKRVVIMTDLAQSENELGNYARTASLLAEALTIQGEYLAIDSTEIARTLMRLGSAHQMNGEYDRAERSYLGALGSARANSGDRSEDVGELLNLLGMLYTNIARDQEAEAAFGESLSIAQEHYESDDSRVLGPIHNLAILYDNTGRPELAVDYFNQVLKVEDESLGRDHLSNANTRHNLAFAHRTLEEYDLAEKLFQEALEIKERKLGVDHPLLIPTLNGLAGTYQLQGRNKRAAPYLVRAIRIWELRLGPLHPGGVISLHELGRVRSEQGRVAESRDLLQRALLVASNSEGSEADLVPSIQQLLEALPKR